MPVIAERPKAYALPHGEYYSPENAHLQASEMALINMEHTGITDSDSKVPVLGTAALKGCTGIALYNKQTKKLVLRHDLLLSEYEFKDMMEQVRSSPDQLIEAHVIGAGHNPNLSRAYTDADNEKIRDTLDAVLAAMEQTPNLIVKTCDVGEKPHPTGFAVDSRNGRLIRGTPDVTDPWRMDEPNFFEGQLMKPGDFDGTTPEHRSQKAI